MRKTGKLHFLTICSVAAATTATISVCFWNEKTSSWHLWLDIIPQGFGMASLITTTLIVSFGFPVKFSLMLNLFQAMIAGVAKEDLAVATGSK